MKNRIAFWLHGGIGTGHFDQGYPVLEKILQDLSRQYNLTVYSVVAPNTGYQSHGFAISTPSRFIKWEKLRWMILIFRFFLDDLSARYQVIFSLWGYPSGVVVVRLGKLLRRPTIIYLLGQDAAGIPSIDYGILHHPESRRKAFRAYENATRLLGISSYQPMELKKYGFNRTVEIIPWGADPTRFKFRQRMKSTPLKILHVGHLTPIKDQMTLLKAFLKIRVAHPVKLRIIGVDLLGGKLQDYCAAQGASDDVEFLGMKPYTEMPLHFDWADLMLHTSLSEGQSMAVTEAAASGLLIAGTNVGLMYDLGPDCCILAEPGQWEILADEIVMHMTDDKRWQEKVMCARKWSERHDHQWTVRELVRIVEETKVPA